MIPELGHFALALGVAFAGALAGFPPWGAHDRDARLMATAPPLVACRAHDRGRLYIARLQRQSSGEHAWSRLAGRRILTQLPGLRCKTQCRPWQGQLAQNSAAWRRHVLKARRLSRRGVTGGDRDAAANVDKIAA